jgi:hypothetical protein
MFSKSLALIFLSVFLISFVSACDVGDISFGQYCDLDSVMKDLKLRGDACVNGFECVDGYCVQDVCASRSSYLEIEQPDIDFSLSCTPEEDDCAEDGMWIAVCNAENVWEEKNVYVEGHCGFTIVVSSASSGGGGGSSSSSLVEYGADEVFCGNNYCNPDENCDSCPMDCGSCFLAKSSGLNVLVEESTCGDDICDIDESSNNCINDCVLLKSQSSSLGWLWLILLLILLIVAGYVLYDRKKSGRWFSFIKR